MCVFNLDLNTVFEVLAHYANTGNETLSPFIDSSIDNVLLQTNSGCTQLLLDFTNIPKLYLVDTLLHDSQTL